MVTAGCFPCWIATRSATVGRQRAALTYAVNILVCRSLLSHFCRSGVCRPGDIPTGFVFETFLSGSGDAVLANMRDSRDRATN